MLACSDLRLAQEQELSFRERENVLPSSVLGPAAAEHFMEVSYAKPQRGEDSQLVSICRMYFFLLVVRKKRLVTSQPGSNFRGEKKSTDSYHIPFSLEKVWLVRKKQGQELCSSTVSKPSFQNEQGKAKKSIRFAWLTLFDRLVLVCCLQILRVCCCFSKNLGKDKKEGKNG